jgi:hypothetical protein
VGFVDRISRVARNIAIIAAAPKKTKSPARQSSSFQPPKSRYVASRPKIIALTNAAASSPIHRAERPAGTKRAAAKTTSAQAVQSAIPMMRRRLARLSHQSGPG